MGVETYISGEIERLKKSRIKADKLKAYQLEIQVEHTKNQLENSKKLDAVVVQTTLTNGRVNVHDVKLEKIEVTLGELTEALSKVRWLKANTYSVIGAIVVLLGLVFGFLATPLGDRLVASRSESAVEVSDLTAAKIVLELKNQGMLKDSPDVLKKK